MGTLFNGTPAALPLMPAKLDRMSPRTTPDALNTVGPFDPSAGYGPSVSSGMRQHYEQPHDDFGGLQREPANCNAPKCGTEARP